VTIGLTTIAALVATLGCAYVAGGRGASGARGWLGAGALLGCLALAIVAGPFAAGRALPAWSVVLLPTATFLAAGGLAALAASLGESHRLRHHVARPTLPSPLAQSFRP
jgi:hypothetical protein